MTPHAYSNYTRSHSKFPVTALAQVALSYTKFPVNTFVFRMFIFSPVGSKAASSRARFCDAASADEAKRTRSSAYIINFKTSSPEALTKVAPESRGRASRIARSMYRLKMKGEHTSPCCVPLFVRKDLLKVLSGYYNTTSSSHMFSISCVAFFPYPYLVRTSGSFRLSS